MSKTWAWATGIGLFLALSVADFFQTYALIAGGPAHEANPVAAEWLARYGWAGLAVFKGLITLTVFAAVGLLALRGSPAGGRVLALGCAVLMGVGVYSRGLLTAERAEAAAESQLVVEVCPGHDGWMTGPTAAEVARS